MRSFSILFFITVLIFPLLTGAQEDELSWPREIKTKENIITIYQPQLDSFVGDTLEGRMAISIKPVEGNLLFCSAWFKAQVSTDLNERTVVLESITIPRIYFPDINDDQKIERLRHFLKNEIESWNLVMSLDHLLTGLGEVENLDRKPVKLNNDPPDIYFRTAPAMLISIDGDPVFSDIENSNLTYVVNTAFFIVKDKKNGLLYIRGGNFWYVSDEIFTGWEENRNVPADIKKLADENYTPPESDSLSAELKEAPALIVVKKPSEVVITNGQPDYATIPGTALLYVKNSESDIIMDINTQDHYLLIAGRWFHSRSLKDGEWKFCEPADLPPDFAKIPEDSDLSSVRASIPGTPEARDALLEQNIPQTATVDRKTATVNVSYDGNPEFKMIEKTEIAYAVNSDKTVLKINNKYYCVDNGIWFIADKAQGPWEVSDVRPDEIDQLPPSSEVYNVKYVYVFDSTPEVVYVGYYPGYTYSYIYGGVVVYGTGYWYHPWYRHTYYPRPVTYGFGVHYNPWTGWGFSVGFSYGWISWGFHPYPRWWGPGGYRYGYRHGYYYGYHQGVRTGYRAGYAAASRNVYRNQVTGIRQTRPIKRDLRTTGGDRLSKPSTRPNNVYTDKQGNIVQRNNNGNWEQKSNKKVSDQSKKAPATRETKSRVNTKQSKQLDNSYKSRERGNKNYNRSRSNTSGKTSTRSTRSKRR